MNLEVEITEGGFGTQSKELRVQDYFLKGLIVQA